MRFLILGLVLLTPACARDMHQAARDCAARSGCVSSFPERGYGPIHQQAVAPEGVPGLQPQR